MIAASIPVLLNVTLTLHWYSARPELLGVPASLGSLAGSLVLFVLMHLNRKALARRELIRRSSCRTILRCARTCSNCSRGGSAHATFEDTVKDMPLDLIGVRPAGCPYSAWELLEHIRIAQHDILEFSRSAEYISPEWPAGYWPKAPVPAHSRDWIESVKTVIARPQGVRSPHLRRGQRPP